MTTVPLNVPQADRQPLPDVYHDWIATTVDKKGFEIPHGLIVTDDGSMTVVALAVPPDQAYRTMLALWVRDNPTEMIFALDRFAKEGQGTRLGDLMAGHYFTRDARRPFIIEYQFAPRIIEPICWDNPIWNEMLDGEYAQQFLAIGRAAQAGAR